MSSPNQLSFLPDDYLERKAQRRTNVVCAILFVLVAGAIATAFTYSENALDAARAEAEKVNVAYAEAARPIEQFRQLQEKQRTMNTQAEISASLLEKVPRSNLLAEFTQACAETNVTLLDLVLDSRLRTPPAAAAAKTPFEKKKSEITGAKKNDHAAPVARAYDVSMKLTGIATTDVQVSQFITYLNRSRLLSDVNLLISDEHDYDGAKVRKFQIELMIHPDAVVEPVKPAVDTRTVAVEVVE